jgi:competence protein ComEA
VAADDDADVDRPDPDARITPLNSLLTDTVVPWFRFVGPVRLLASVGVLLLLAGIGWWMLRSPVTPTESRLPLAGRAAAADGTASTGPRDRASPSTVTAPAPPQTPPAVVVIHVTGAVHAPGVYELNPGQRVADAIDAAGGALADAEPDALNLAAPLADGDRIAVPTAAEVAAGSGGAGHSHAGGEGADSASGPVAGPVDVNSATAAELETLPGIGPATAAAIVEHRRLNGPFASVDELDEVRGIGTSKLDAIRDQVTV